LDRDRRPPDVRDRMRVGSAAELPRRTGVSAHPGHRQPDLVQAERRHDRANADSRPGPLAARLARPGVAGGADGAGGGAATALTHDPEKWVPVFQKDYAQTIS